MLPRTALPVVLTLLASALVPGTTAPVAASPTYVPVMDVDDAPGYDALVSTLPDRTTVAVWATGAFGDRDVVFSLHRPGRPWTEWTTPSRVDPAGLPLEPGSPNLDMVTDRAGNLTVGWVAVTAGGS